jgi:carboxyvinyl-carboxyphosphonate phosphorylmutase
MPQATATERRRRFRALLERTAVTHPASVFDAASARLAEAAGFELGLFAGSVGSAVVLGAPDLVVLTLSEFAAQAARVGRGNGLPLIVDADHGYGNALNVMRTVEELETAGVAALTIEDTLLPRRFGGPEGELISRDEYRDKLRAALAARSDPALCLLGRLSVARAGIDETRARLADCAVAGVDAVMLQGALDFDELQAVRDAAPDMLLVLSGQPAANDVLAANGVRIVFQGHLPYFVMLRALYEAYVEAQETGSTAGLRERALSAELQSVALRGNEYAAWTKEYLGGS